eukprot:TRINITY_DN20466_c0_g2_i2.p1 TRINITY_DN20466_c0_g2~~TRINITY_DN20466_c0_g2_i2.p1  ORF type:complete len:349 (-),score=80.22 TRINITY_DN20466_c0_g2_i2:71-1117(-)
MLMSGVTMVSPAWVPWSSKLPGLRAYVEEAPIQTQPLANERTSGSRDLRMHRGGGSITPHQSYLSRLMMNSAPAVLVGGGLGGGVLLVRKKRHKECVAVHHVTRCVAESADSNLDELASFSRSLPPNKPKDDVSMASLLDELSEEELLEFELADDDIDLELNEEEEEEWRLYDEQVKQLSELTGLQERQAGLNRAQDLGVPAIDLELGTKAEQAGGASSSTARPADDHDDEDSSQALVSPAREVMDMAIPAGSVGLDSELPAEYISRLVDGKGGVVVSTELGPQTVVLFAQSPNQAELLPELSLTLRAKGVRIVRGWRETKSPLVMNVFEVCDERMRLCCKPFAKFLL